MPRLRIYCGAIEAIAFCLPVEYEPDLKNLESLLILWGSRTGCASAHSHD